MLLSTNKLLLVILGTIALATLLTACGDQDEITPTVPPAPEPTGTPVTPAIESTIEEPTPLPESTKVPEEILIGDPVIEYSADSKNILAGECTNLRWRTENVETVYIHPIFDAYDKYLMDAEGVLEVCPTETLPYLLRADLADGTTKGRSVTIVVTAP